MKHTMLDPTIERARSAGLKAADRLRNNIQNNVLEPITSNVHEIKLSKDLTDNTIGHTGSVTPTSSSVRHLQHRSKSLSCEKEMNKNREQQQNNENNSVNVGTNNSESGRSNSLKKSASVSGNIIHTGTDLASKGLNKAR